MVVSVQLTLELLTNLRAYPLITSHSSETFMELQVTGMNWTYWATLGFVADPLS